MGFITQENVPIVGLEAYVWPEVAIWPKRLLTFVAEKCDVDKRCFVIVIEAIGIGRILIHSSILRAGAGWSMLAKVTRTNHVARRLRKGVTEAMEEPPKESATIVAILPLRR
jgi:hypothetical protein